MAGDKLATILDVYAHEFDQARNRDDLRSKLAAGTSIRIGV